MENVPKLPMFNFGLKESAEATTFGNLKQFIAELYAENPETYSKEVYELEGLRNAATRPSANVTGCNILKRYYCQLHSLQNRFPLTPDRQLFTFLWRDIYSTGVTQSSDIRYDLAVILYNYAALHTQLGSLESRSTSDEMKKACTHFQCAAWALGHLEETYPQAATGDLSSEVLLVLQQICLAQAQECILEKSLSDKRKSGIIAKVAAQVITYYNSAAAVLLSGGEDGSVAELIGSKKFKEWKRYINFKTTYLSSILFLYQGQQAEEQQKMGERVVLFQVACDKLEEAKTESKGMSNIDKINEVLQFVGEFVEAKRKAAKNENEFIYHEEVPDISTIPAVQGANLVSGIGFSVTDPEVAGEDIFKRLIPMKAHEASSMYSEEKANLLRSISQLVEGKDNELNKFMNSLNVESLNIDNNNTQLPQALVDRCAAINANHKAIPDLVAAMSNLAETCADVESMLSDIRELLQQEDAQESLYQKTMGTRPSGHFTELNREFQKYQEAHHKAGESNETLRKAMDLHVNNLKTLAQPLKTIQQSIPVCERNASDTSLIELNALLDKVNEMRTQRAQLYAELRDDITNDDITAKIIAWGDDKLVNLFKTEIKKHEKKMALIGQNMSAQGNIFRALTESYAKCVPHIKLQVETKQKREHFFSSLIASYDLYDDLLSKSSKGLEFYKKLQGNIQKLYARVRGARDVQDEERQQRLKSTKSSANTTVDSTPRNNGPKLKDYLKSGTGGYNIGSTDIPLIRPSPLGSEATTTNCKSIPNKYNPQVAYEFNEPPPAYSQYNTGYDNYTAQQQYNPVDVGSSAQSYGYSNPIYKTYSNSHLPMAYDGNPVQAVYSQTESNYRQSVVQNTQPQPQQQQYSQYNQYDSSVPTTAVAGYNSFYQPQTNQQLNYSTSHTIQPPIYSTSQAVQPSLYSTSQSQMYGQPVQQQYPSMDQQSMNPIQASYQSSTGYHPQTNVTASLQMDPQQNLPYQMSQLSIDATQHSTFPITSTQNYFPAPHEPYTQTTSQSNYKFTANPQYVTGYDQSVSMAQINPDHSQSTGTVSSAATPTVINSHEPGQSYSSHPGYNYNQHTGEYSYGYGSGYQTNQLTQPIYSHYMSDGRQISTPTDSVVTSGPSVSMYDNQYTNYNYDGSIQPTAAGYNQNAPTMPPTSGSYFHLPYGTHALPSPHSIDDLNRTNIPCQATINTNDNDIRCHISSDSKNAPLTYMQSNKCASTTTTDSADGTVSQDPPQQLQQPQQQQQFQPQQQTQIQQHVEPQPKSIPTIQPTQVSKTVPKYEPKVPSTVPKPISNIDLLSDLDFAPCQLSIAPLQPKQASEAVMIPAVFPIKEEAKVKEEIVEQKLVDESDVPGKPSQQFIIPTKQLIVDDRKLSVDNMSISSDLSSIDQNFDAGGPDFNESASTSNKFADIVIDDPKILKWFHKEVENIEKAIESLKVKTLNGATPLDSKWKELQDLLFKDELKRTTNIAKLFPEKNRLSDCIPYDHGRVHLPTTTDDYINAAYVNELGPRCPSFILAQTPLTNTVKDFWCMIWSEQSKVIACLHSSTEMLDPFFPQELDKECSYGDYSVTVLKQFDLTHCIERNVRLTLNGSDIVQNISIIQIKSWPKNSTANILGIAHNIITTCKQYSTNSNTGPIILNCITAADRSGMIALAIAAIWATKCRRPVIINVIDVWFRLCCQRKHALRDISALQLSMEVILANAHDVLNKHGLTTSYQMKITQVHEANEKQRINDPLNDLDPLWKLK